MRLSVCLIYGLYSYTICSLDCQCHNKAKFSALDRKLKSAMLTQYSSYNHIRQEIRKGRPNQTFSKQNIYKDSDKEKSGRAVLIKILIRLIRRGILFSSLSTSKVAASKRQLVNIFFKPLGGKLMLLF